RRIGQMREQLARRHDSDVELGELSHVMRARVGLVGEYADPVTQRPQSAQDATGPEGAGVLVRAGNPMIDVENHAGARHFTGPSAWPASPGTLAGMLQS